MLEELSGWMTIVSRVDTEAPPRAITEEEVRQATRRDQTLNNLVKVVQTGRGRKEMHKGPYTQVLDS